VTGFPQSQNIINDDEEDDEIRIPESLYTSDSISNYDFNEFINCDNDLECYGDLTDEEICALVRPLDEIDATVETENIVEFEESEMVAPSSQDALKSLSILRAYMDNKGSDCVQYYTLEKHIQMLSRNSVKQSTIDRFLSDF
jgi:hypothetical protein